MLHEFLQLYTIFLFVVVCIRSISITSLERLTCESDRYKPIQGCIGTFILPNVVLTTSYCGEKCEYVGKSPIIRSVIHPHYKNYVHGNDFIARNDIALVVTLQDERKRKLMKLSALDYKSAVGLKALIPIMDADNPRLAVTVVQRCYIELPFGYYVCASNIVTKRTIQVCRERKEQGVPLIIEDRIFGIMGITEKDSCKLPQRSFTALTPALDWISETVRNLGYDDAVISTLHDITSTPFQTPSLDTTSTTTHPSPTYPPSNDYTYPAETSPTYTNTTILPVHKRTLSLKYEDYRTETYPSIPYAVYPSPDNTPSTSPSSDESSIGKWHLMKQPSQTTNTISTTIPPVPKIYSSPSTFLSEIHTNVYFTRPTDMSTIRGSSGGLLVTVQNVARNTPWRQVSNKMHVTDAIPSMGPYPSGFRSLNPVRLSPFVTLATSSRTRATTLLKTSAPRNTTKRTTVLLQLQLLSS